MSQATRATAGRARQQAKKTGAPKTPRRGGPRKPPFPTDPHVAKALAYCRDVVEGRILACKLVIAACQRQLDDLERSRSDPSWPYVFDEGRAGRVCRYVEQLPHIKGPKGGQLIELEPWQCFVYTTVFGWVRRDTQRRRFRRVYIEVPRGNAKSTMSSGTALYCLSADGEPGAEVYSAATTRDQAKIVWGDAAAMLKKRRPLKTRLGLESTRHAIFQAATDSKFVPLSRDADNLDGLNIHCAVIDELHAHKTREVYDVVETGTGKRDQSLLWVITTAGSDTSGIGYEVRSFCVKLLEGVLEDDSQFAVIYTIDQGDDWTSPEVWRKANPNWGVSVQPDVFAQLARKAMNVASAQGNFLTKHLNVWVSAGQSWMNMAAWEKCADPSLRLEDFREDPCFAAFDLSSKVDIAASVALFYRDLPAVSAKGEPTTERHYYLFLKSYLPEAAIRESSNSQYQGWVKDGWITPTSGDVIDFDLIREDHIALSKEVNLRETAYDPWQAQQLANELQREGLVLVELRPTVQNFSEPMKELEALVRSGRLHHDGNPVLRWMVSNVVCKYDAKDNIYPRKLRPENKIDGAVAAIMAMNRAMLAPEEETSVYETRGIRFL